MSAQLTIESQREGAEIHYGAEIGKKKCLELLEELHLPKGLLPLSDILEVGRNTETGFVWVKQAKGTQHTFQKIGRVVSYAPEVTALVEDRRMKRVTGVKSKELLIWVSINEMYIDDQAADKITFRATAGIGRSFPISAFEEE